MFFFFFLRKILIVYICICKVRFKSYTGYYKENFLKVASKCWQNFEPIISWILSGLKYDLAIILYYIYIYISIFSLQCMIYINGVMYNYNYLFLIIVYLHCEDVHLDASIN